MNMYVPFNDLTRINNPIKNKVLKKFEKIVDKNDFVLNEDTKTFESNFSNFTKQKYSVSCANGTDAIELLLRGLGIGIGDEVIVPVNTYIATSFAVENVGAIPVFVDNDEYYLIDVKKIESKITKNTKAVIGVNLYGQMCDTLALKKLCKQYGLYFLEDSAQSHGAMQLNFNVGDNSAGAAYSFYPGKNLGAWGDGGIVTTNSLNTYKRMIRIRNFGSVVKYYHEIKGGNTRLQPLQAIVLNEKLNYLKGWNQERGSISERYIESLQDVSKIKLPKIADGNKHVWHLFVIQVPNRKNFIEYCKKSGVELGVHYPFPIVKQKAYLNHSQKKEVFYKSFSQYKKLVTLPVFPEMKKEETNYVIEVVRKFFK